MRGFGAYRVVPATPGAGRLVAASLPARLSFGLFDLALVLLIERATGSFAAAGVAIGLHAAGVAVGGVVAGVLVEGPGTDAAFLAGAGLAMAAALVVLAASGRSRSRSATP